MSKATYLQSFCKMDEAKKYPFDITFLQHSSLEKQMAYGWMISNEKVIEEMQGNCNYYLVHYEDLSQDAKSNTKEMFRFAELGWNSQTDYFIRRIGGRQSVGYFNVMRSPDSAMHQWRSELSRKQIKEIASVTSCSRIHDMFKW